MAFDYISARETAKRLILNFGGEGSVFIPAIEAGDQEDDGTIIAGSPQVTIPGIITPRLPVEKSEINGKNIVQGDWFCFFQHETQSSIDIGMFTTINNVKHRIVATEALESLEGVEVLLELTIRGQGG